MSEKINDNRPELNNQEPMSLDDGRRVKVLSPGMMVFKRFIRNRLAIVGICILIFMFLFSFLGGVISPYRHKNKPVIFSDSFLQKTHGFFLAPRGRKEIGRILLGEKQILIVDECVSEACGQCCSQCAFSCPIQAANQNPHALPSRMLLFIIDRYSRSFIAICAPCAR